MAPTPVNNSAASGVDVKKAKQMERLSELNARKKEKGVQKAKARVPVTSFKKSNIAPFIAASSMTTMFSGETSDLTVQFMNDYLREMIRRSLRVMPANGKVLMNKHVLPTIDTVYDLSLTDPSFAPAKVKLPKKEKTKKKSNKRKGMRGRFPTTEFDDGSGAVDEGDDDDDEESDGSDDSGSDDDDIKDKDYEEKHESEEESEEEADASDHEEEEEEEEEEESEEEEEEEGSDDDDDE